ncbi:MAG: type II toxin-antitoxin system Phd/YefM family antitoxin [Patescibacteria group bacterium]
MLVPTVNNTRNITDFRTNPDSILETVKKLDGPLYLFRGSVPKAIVLDPEKYNEMLEMIEDYQDELRALELESDAKRHQGAVSFKQVLKENGIKYTVRPKS